MLHFRIAVLTAIILSFIMLNAVAPLQGIHYSSTKGLYVRSPSQNMSFKKIQLRRQKRKTWIDLFSQKSFKFFFS
jgi:hypothetical protein